jgi:hypothetical protein
MNNVHTSSAMTLAQFLNGVYIFAIGRDVFTAYSTYLFDHGGADALESFMTKYMDMSKLSSVLDALGVYASMSSNQASGLDIKLKHVQTSIAYIQTMYETPKLLPYLPQINVGLLVQKANALSEVRTEIETRFPSRAVYSHEQNGQNGGGAPAKRTRRETDTHGNMTKLAHHMPNRLQYRAQGFDKASIMRTVGAFAGVEGADQEEEEEEEENNITVEVAGSGAVLARGVPVPPNATAKLVYSTIMTANWPGHAQKKGQSCRMFVGHAGHEIKSESVQVVEWTPGQRIVAVALGASYAYALTKTVVVNTDPFDGVRAIVWPDDATLHGCTSLGKTFAVDGTGVVTTPAHPPIHLNMVDVTYSPHNPNMIALLEDNFRELVVLNVVTGITVVHRTPGGFIRSVAWSPVNPNSISFVGDNTVYVWDISTTTATTLFEFTEDSGCLVWSPDGTKLAFIQLSDMTNGWTSAHRALIIDATIPNTVLHELEVDLHAPDEYTMSWNSHNPVLAIICNVGHTHRVQLCNTDTGELLESYQFGNGIRFVAWNPMSPTMLAVGGYDADVYVVDTYHNTVHTVPGDPGQTNNGPILWNHNTMATIYTTDGSSGVQLWSPSPV